MINIHVSSKYLEQVKIFDREITQYHLILALLAQSLHQQLKTLLGLMDSSNQFDTFWGVTE